MGRTFHLTSPHMKGDDVRAMQNALKRHNYLQGTVDGEFGPDSARAAYRAKYWLGYLKPDQTAGDKLYGYLTGVTKPSLAMRLITSRRRAALPKQSIGQKMLALEKKYEGTKENPSGSNRVLFSLWYGLIGPWCAMFQSYSGVNAGSKAFIRGKRYSYVPYVLADAKAGLNNLTVTYRPVPGDLVLFDWDSDGTPDHIGILDHFVDRERMVTVEGNTGIGNDSNGGEVMIRSDRVKSEVIAFVHVGK